MLSFYDYRTKSLFIWQYVGLRSFVLRLSSKRLEIAWIGESLASFWFSAYAPYSVVLLKWRLNAIVIPFITCIKLPLAVFCSTIIKTPFQKHNAALPSRKKQPGNWPFFETFVTSSNTNVYSDFPKTAISWLLYMVKSFVG